MDLRESLEDIGRNSLLDKAAKHEVWLNDQHSLISQILEEFVSGVPALTEDSLFIETSKHKLEKEWDYASRSEWGCHGGTR